MNKYGLSQNEPLKYYKKKYMLDNSIGTHRLQIYLIT